MTSKGKRFYSDSGEYWHTLKDFIESGDFAAGDTLLTGTGRKPTGADLVKNLGTHGDSITETIIDNNDEWFLDEWRPVANAEAEQELSDLIAGWIDRHIPVTDYTIESDGEYVITEADVKGETNDE